MKQLVFAAGLAMFAACAPTSKNVVEVGDPKAAAPEPAPVAPPPPTEVAIQIDPLELKGALFTPVALDYPELATLATLPKRTIVEQEKRAARAKGVARANDTRDLALLLWVTPAAAPDQKEAKKLLKAQRERALGLLTGLAAEPNASEDTLAAYAGAELAVGDESKAAAAYDTLIGKFGKSGKIARYQALRDYLALKARAPLPFPLPESLEGAPYEAAYVAAWARLRAGDKPGAIAAITTAARAWTNVETLPGLRREVTLIYSRAGGAPADAYALLEELSKRDGSEFARSADALADAYGYAGEFEAAAALREKQVAGAPPQKLGEIRLAQSLLYYRLVRPVEAADAVLAAWASVQAAGDSVPVELREAVAKQMINFGKIFHTDFAKSHDARFATPAKKLYTAYLAIPGRADAETVKSDLVPNLDSTMKTYGDAKAPASVGVLDAPVVQRYVAAFLPQVSACYEAALQGDAALAVSGKLLFAIAKDGKVTSAKLEGVAPGEAPAAVAKCVSERASAWVFPASGTAATVTYPLAFKSSK